MLKYYFDTATKLNFIIFGIIFIILIPSFANMTLPLILDYEIHRLLHILGATLFIGNILVTGVWGFLASRAGTEILPFASKTINWVDVFFTGPGAILLIYNGITLASLWSYELTWIGIPYFLFLGTGLIWIFSLVRYQSNLVLIGSMIENETDSTKMKALTDQFNGIFNRWTIWGILAVILPLIAMVFMVLKI
ncbi:MAG: DUF2269 family protein [Candidatus Hodarchaeales archaeon]|jgi:hypothetical protein